MKFLNFLHGLGIFASIIVSMILGMLMGGQVVNAYLAAQQSVIAISTPEQKSNSTIGNFTTTSVQTVVVAPTTPAAASPPTTADNLSALSLVVALVTLIMTLGSSYLMAKQRELQSLIDLEKLRHRLAQLQIEAEADIFVYFKEYSAPDAAARTSSLSIWLKMLSSENSVRRVEANQQLARQIGPANISELSLVRRYVEEAIEYHVNNGRKEVIQEIRFYRA